MNKHRTNNNFDTQESTHKIKQYYSINEKLTFNHQQHLFSYSTARSRESINSKCFSTNIILDIFHAVFLQIR